MPETLDKATEELLYNNAILMSSHESGHDKLVKKLLEGDEIQWEFVRTLALHGEIPRETALKALTGCLVDRIPYYQRASKVEVSPGNYWVGREQEARRALCSIKDPNSDIVVYRGIPLAKK